LDAQGQPVVNALVLVMGALSFGGKQGVSLTIARSGKDGRFVNHSNGTEGSLDVYVAEPHEGLDNELSPYLRIFITKPSPTIHIDHPKGKQDVGDVTVQIRWRPIAITVLNARSEAHLSRDDAMSLFTRIRNEAGVVVDEFPALTWGSSHKNYIQLALPVGRWSIDVGIKRKDTFVLWNSIGDPIEIKGGEPLFTASVIIPDAKR